MYRSGFGYRAIKTYPYEIIVHFSGQTPPPHPSPVYIEDNIVTKETYLGRIYTESNWLQFLKMHPKGVSEGIEDLEER